MAIDIAQVIKRYESGDTFQFTMSTSGTNPATADFRMYDVVGGVVPISQVQSGYVVANSAANLLYFNRVLPTTTGLYSYEWTLWDAASRPYFVRNEFEIVLTLGNSFFTYGNISDIVVSARQLIGRTDITPLEMRPYCQGADGYIDSFLGKIMTVPVSPIPIIADMSKVYTLWRLYCDRYSGEKDAEPPAIKSRKEDYDKLLWAVIAGSLTLAGLTPDVATFNQVSIVPQVPYNPVFDMRDFESQHVDRDLLDFEQGRDKG